MKLFRRNDGEWIHQPLEPYWYFLGFGLVILAMVYPTQLVTGPGSIGGWVLTLLLAYVAASVAIGFVWGGVVLIQQKGRRD